MSWDQFFPVMIKSLVGDFATPPAYSNDRLIQSTLVSSLIVTADMPLSTTYSIDLLGSGISPDPTLADTYDADAIALIGLKAACLLNMANFQKAAGSSILIKDGDSEISTAAGGLAWKSVITDGPCRSYDLLVKKLTATEGANGGGKHGSAVCGPVSHLQFGLGAGGHLGDYLNIPRWFDNYSMTL